MRAATVLEAKVDVYRALHIIKNEAESQSRVGFSLGV